MESETDRGSISPLPLDLSTLCKRHLNLASALDDVLGVGEFCHGYPMNTDSHGNAVWLSVWEIIASVPCAACRPLAVPSHFPTPNGGTRKLAMPASMDNLPGCF